MYRKLAIFFITQLVLSQYETSAFLGQYPRKTEDETGNKIVDGEPTEEGRYPYQVGLSTTEGFIECGASLVDSNWVLSAAHCSGVTHVEIGRYELCDWNETYERIEVAFEMVKHPNYDNRTMENDLMLLRLKEPSSYDTVTLDDGSASLSAGTNKRTNQLNKKIKYQTCTSNNVVYQIVCFICIFILF